MAWNGMRARPKVRKDRHRNRLSFESLEGRLLLAADPRIIGSASPNPVLVNGALTFSYEVTNAGPDSAQVSFSDQLPANVTFQSAESSVGTPMFVGDTVTIDLGTLAANATANITIVVSADSPGTVTNLAAIAVPDDPNPENNSLTTITQVLAFSDVALTGSAQPSPVFVGEALTYSYQINNPGPGPAEISFSDVLPQTLTNIEVTSSVGTPVIVGNSVSIDFGMVDAGTQVTVTITARPTVVGQLTNTATITVPNDPNQDNNELELITNVTAHADVAITGTVTPNPVHIGNELTYSYTITNPGPDARPVTFSDLVPNTLEIVSVDSSVGTPVIEGNAVTIDFGTLDPDTNATVTLVARPLATGVISNTATITVPDDPQPNNNSLALTVQSVRNADVTLSGTATPQPVAQGGYLTYSYTVKNNGPDPAPVTFTDNVPSALNIIQATSTVGTPVINSATRQVTINLGTLEPNAEATVTILTVPTSVGTVQNTAFITVPDDPDQSDNTLTLTSTVQLGINLSLTATATPNPVVVGQNLTFAFVVTNTGAAAASEVEFTNNLPENLEVVEAFTSTGTVTTDPETNSVSAEIGSLAIGASVRILVVAKTLSTGTVTNTASVTSTAATPPEINPANNTAVSTGQVVAQGGGGGIPSDTTPPTVTLLNRFGQHRQRTSLLLTFSQPLDPATAMRKANYRVRLAGRDGQFGTSDDRNARIRSVTYDPTNRNVIVTLVGRLSPQQLARLTVVGTGPNGVANLNGILLDGAGNGQPGSNFVRDFFGFGPGPITD